jgi:hypothetical protein
MDANMSEPHSLVIETVIEFMRHSGNAERALAQHRRLPDGRCSGCLTQLTEWPCSVANFALQALRKQR